MDSVTLSNDKIVNTPIPAGIVVPSKEKPITVSGPVLTVNP
jgi:hypothetical protein